MDMDQLKQILAAQQQQHQEAMAQQQQTMAQQQQAIAQMSAAALPVNSCAALDAGGGASLLKRHPEECFKKKHKKESSHLPNPIKGEVLCPWYKSSVVLRRFIHIVV
uniref:Uncharacterized protein n=1 Tax=Ditylenchus dipsaci TaxID=166011 RepID=A0A915DJN6_9BILA